MKKATKYLLLAALATSPVYASELETEASETAVLSPVQQLRNAQIKAEVGYYSMIYRKAAVQNENIAILIDDKLDNKIQVMSPLWVALPRHQGIGRSWRRVRGHTIYNLEGATTSDHTGLLTQTKVWPLYTHKFGYILKMNSIVFKAVKEQTTEIEGGQIIDGPPRYTARLVKAEGNTTGSLQTPYKDYSLMVEPGAVNHYVVDFKLQ